MPLIYLGLTKKHSWFSSASNHLNQHFPDVATSHPCPLGFRAGAIDATWPSLCYFHVPQLNSLLCYKVQGKINTTVISCHLFCIHFKLKANSLYIFHPIRMERSEHPNMPNVLQVAVYIDVLLLTLVLCFFPPCKRTSDTLPENTRCDAWSSALLVPYANPPVKFTSLRPTNSPRVQDFQSFPVPWISIQRCPVYISGLWWK